LKGGRKLEFFSGLGIASLIEKTAETTAINEAGNIMTSEVPNVIGENSGLSFGDLELNSESIKALNENLDNGRYQELAEFREASKVNPEIARHYVNDIHLKGQMGEGIMESNLSRFGEVQSQVHHQLEGNDNKNIIDLHLLSSHENIKQVELAMDNGQISLENNYDIQKGESASFEVKNGGLPYLRQEVVSGELGEQILAGKDIAEHSFVVINEDTARELIENPETGEMIIKQIQESGGKLILGLPKEEVQLGIF
jgi:hypothetical protein